MPSGIYKRVKRRRGWHFSDESKEVLRKSKMGHPVSIETKNKIRSKMMGKKLSNEHRKNISNSWDYNKHITQKLRDSASRNMKKMIEKGLIKNNAGWNKGIPATEEHKNKLKEKRRYRIFPIKDTSIEVKMQNLLKQLGIQFLTHQYIKDIEHGYQCDILIPVQPGISKKTIIECDGDYWHGHWRFQLKLSKNQKQQQEKDLVRTNELRDKGYRVLRFWENEIMAMELIDLKQLFIKLKELNDLVNKKEVKK